MKFHRPNHHPVQGSQRETVLNHIFFVYQLANKKIITETPGNYNLLILIKKKILPSKLL